MKNVLKILTIAGLVLAVTLALASCDDGKKSTPMIPAGGSKWKAPKAFLAVSHAFITHLQAEITLEWEAPDNPPKDGATELLDSYYVVSYKQAADRETANLNKETTALTTAITVDGGVAYVFELYTVYKKDKDTAVPTFADLDEFDNYKEKAKFKDNRVATAAYPTAAFTAGIVTGAAATNGDGTSTVSWTLPTTTKPDGWDIVGVAVKYRKGTDAWAVWATGYHADAYTGTSYIITGLTNSQEYTFEIYVIYDKTGSTSVTGNTMYNTVPLLDAFPSKSAAVITTATPTS